MSYFTNQYDRGFGGGQKAGMRLWERGRRSVGEARFGKDGQAAAAAAPAPAEAGAPTAAEAPAAAAAAPTAASAARWGHIYTSLVCQSCHRHKTKWLVLDAGEIFIHSYFVRIK